MRRALHGAFLENKESNSQGLPFCLNGSNCGQARSSLPRDGAWSRHGRMRLALRFFHRFGMKSDHGCVTHFSKSAEVLESLPPALDDGGGVMTPRKMHRAQTYLGYIFEKVVPFCWKYAATHFEGVLGQQAGSLG
mmetsp:Transcript_20043/g.47128  ORF Transcript_20043/g.47128 Transcript_20043/m.47128 type:complete len:135 (+) Transcript_20043:1334-1738(+)